ncbi:CHASE2 domain-containing protein [Planctomycetota bacterium]
MGKDRSIKRLSGFKKLAIAAGIAMGITAAVLFVYMIGWLEYPSDKFLDLLFNLRGKIETRKDIVIVEIDEVFKMKYRETNAPVSRKYLGMLLDALVKHQCNVVAFDTLFLKPDWSSDGDTVFIKAINKAWDSDVPVVVGGYFSDKLGLQTPLEQFDAQAGLLNLEMDPDGLIRKMRPIYIMADGSFSPSFSVACYFLKENLEECKVGSEEDGYAYKIGNRLIENDLMIINYTGGKGNFTYISGVAILAGSFDKEMVKDAVIMIADTTQASQDFYNVPFFKDAKGIDREKVSRLIDTGEISGVQDVTMPGVEIHANALQTLLDNSWIRPSSKGNVIIWLIIAGCVTGILFFFSKIPTWLTAVIGVCVVIAQVGTAHLLFSGSYWFDMVPVFLVTLLNLGGGVFYKNVILASANRKVANMFGQYVSANIVDKILKEDIDIALTGQTAEVTVLFSDIRGFTPISEKLSPEEIGRLLNTYFSVMIKTVFDHDGTLDKLMGDAIMAFFGDPVKDKDHPDKACVTALAMMQKLDHMKQNPPVPGIEMVNIGIGINTGPVTVGDLGSFEYRDYTVIGDNVNLGSRLEGMNKMYGTNIIASEFTRAKVGDSFEFRKLDAVRVKGKTEPVTIYELLGKKGDLDSSLQEHMQSFTNGLELYSKAEFDKAIGVFDNLVQTIDDGPSKTFKERCEEYMKNPPEDWDGVYTATSK